MSQIENHWDEISHIETEIKRHMVALGLDWHNETAMSQLASECTAFTPDSAKAAYATHDRHQQTRAELFALVSVMIRTMESAANDNRDVHGGEVWKAFAKHLYH